MTSNDRSNGFDPVARLSTLEDGTQYLGARDRLLWFLQEEDEYSVTSQVERLSNALVIVKVAVAIGAGKKVEALGSAPTNGDYRAVETAETHALARALALLGYGTESALELDTKSVADAPTKPQPGGNGQTKGNGHDGISAVLPSWARLSHIGSGEGEAGKAATETSSGSDSKRGGPSTANGPNRQETQAALTCSDCHEPIREGRTRDGTTLAAEEVAERARKQIGRPLCARCLVKQMAQSKSKEDKSA